MGTLQIQVGPGQWADLPLSHPDAPGAPDPLEIEDDIRMGEYARPMPKLPPSPGPIVWPQRPLVFNEHAQDVQDAQDQLSLELSPEPR